MNQVDPREDLTLETVLEPGDVVQFKRPVEGFPMGTTEYTHGIIVDIFGRFDGGELDGAPKRIAVCKYEPEAGEIDIENPGTGIPQYADFVADELILVYKSGETGYRPHNEDVEGLLRHYSN